MNFVQLFLISSVGKGLATVCTYPVLTVRVLLSTSEDSQKLGVLKFIMKIIGEKGLQGLYKGFYAKLFQTILYNGYLMITYEKLKRVIKYLLLLYLKKKKIVKD